MSPPLGFGIRRNHSNDVLAGRYGQAVCEVIAENFLGRGGRMRRILDAARASAKVCVHGVSMSLGSSDPLDLGHLRALRTLLDDVDALVVSDHLCFTRVDGVSSYDLWPMHFTTEAVMHLAGRIRIVQDVLGRRLCVENVSSYVRWEGDELTEAEFLNAVCTEADCGLLLDVNNLYVNAQNHGFDFMGSLQEIELTRVGQIHIGGHRRVWVGDDGASCAAEEEGVASFLLDDHGGPPTDAVLDALVRIAPTLGTTPVILEWDDRPPGLHEMQRALEALAARLDHRTNAGPGHVAVTS